MKTLVIFFNFLFVLLIGCTAQTEAELRKAFEKFNINGDTWLDGNELTACNCIQFDVNKDGEVSLDEFIAGMKNKNTDQNSSGSAETKPKGRVFAVGDKVEVQEAGIWYAAEILEVKNDQYKIHFVGWGDNWDTWVGPERLRIPGTATTTGNNEQKEDESPEIKNGIPVLKGTAWWVLSVYSKGTEPKNNHIFPPYIFCNNGRFEMQTANFHAGTYRVEGNKLIQVSDGADQLTSTYTISWNAVENYLELTSGDIVIRLRYNKKAAC